MLSRRECLSRAAHWERMARDSLSIADRRMPMETAEHWRTLAKEAKAVDGRDDDAD